MSTACLRVCAVLMAVGAVTPALTRGQLPGNPCATCCQSCYQPRPQCHCVRFKPIVETHMRPRSVMTWRDECYTAYRCQARLETVPVVTYQTRVRYDRVPYTVRRRVPQCTTTLVPERRIRYVPEHAVYSPITPRASYRRPRSWHHAGHRHTSPVPDPIFHNSPVADDLGDWTTISSRRRYDSHRPEFLDDDLYVPDYDDHHDVRPVGYRRSVSAPKPWVRAPSAAMVWQTRPPRN